MRLVILLNGKEIKAKETNKKVRKCIAVFVKERSKRERGRRRDENYRIEDVDDDDG
jgi:hypothetical protein